MENPLMQAELITSKRNRIFNEEDSKVEDHPDDDSSQDDAEEEEEEDEDEDEEEDSVMHEFAASDDS